MNKSLVNLKAVKLLAHGKRLEYSRVGYGGNLTNTQKLELQALNKWRSLQSAVWTKALYSIGVGALSLLLLPISFVLASILFPLLVCAAYFFLQTREESAKLTYLAM